MAIKKGCCGQVKHYLEWIRFRKAPYIPSRLTEGKLQLKLVYLLGESILLPW